jgi:hypothetical protein
VDASWEELSRCRPSSPPYGGVVRGHQGGVHRRFPSGSHHRCQGAHPHQIVYSGREREHPADPCHAPGADVAHHADGFQPSTDGFNLCLFLLTDGVAGVMPRAPIHGPGSACRLQGDMWSPRLLLGEPLSSGYGFTHRERCLALGGASGVGLTRLFQARAMLHERGLLPCRVLVPPGLGFGRRGVRGVGAPLAPAAKPGVARIVGRERRRGRLPLNPRRATAG